MVVVDVAHGVVEVARSTERSRHTNEEELQQQ
jgi:hypothetical protein